MTTLHLSAEDVAELVVDADGGATIELTDKGVRTLEALLAKRAVTRGPSVMQMAITTAPARPSDDAGFAAGYRRGYANGRGPGMPPLRA